MFRVLHAFDVSIPISAGYTYRSKAIISQQRKLGWETFHVTSSKQPCEQTAEVVDGLTFERTNPSGLSKLPIVGHWDVVRTLTPRIKQIAQLQKVDLIHAHSPCLVGLAAANAGTELGLPVAYECRAFWEDAAVDTGNSKEGDLRYRITRRMETKVFKQVDAAICISKGLHEDILARGVERERLHIVGNAVNVEQFKLLTIRDKELELKFGLQDKLVLGFIGSYFAYEGIDQVIRALPEISQHVPNLHLMLVGGGNEEAKLKLLVDSLRLNDRVTFVGRVPHKEVPRYASLVDAFIFPRQAIRLTELVTPLKPLESMAQGKLVIASDVGGHRELIDHGKTGYLFKADDLESLKRVTIEALTGSHKTSQIIQNGLEFVRNERSWESNVRRYEKIYSDMVRKKAF